MKYAAAIDIGGTNTRVALVNENYELIQRVQFETDPIHADHTLNQIQEAIDGFHQEIEGIRMSCPGPLDLKEGRILETPNLKGNWHYLKITENLEQRVAKPVYLENDANLAALAEAVLGQGKAYDIVQYLTVSTGLGAGLVIHQKIFQGAHGYANEVANVCMFNNGPSHGSIYPGGIEALSSGTAIEQRARKAGLNVQHAGQVQELANQGNPAAKQIMQEAKIYLANFIAGIQAYIDPEVIVLGGSVALKIPGFVEEIEALVKQRVYDVVKPYVHITKSTLGQDVGLLGVACLVFQKDRGS